MNKANNLDSNLLRLIESVIKEEVSNLSEQANTVSADVNEILLGYYLLPGSGWGGFVNGKEIKAHLDARGANLDEKDWADQIGRAEAMAQAVLEWAGANGYQGSPVRAWWTARPGVLSSAVGYEVDSRKNPTDTLIQFSNGEFLGISAKSTKTSGDIGFKNPGIGTIARALDVSFVEIYEKKVSKAIKQFGLPPSLKDRKTYIRENPEIKEKTEILGIQLLQDLRNALLEKLITLDHKTLKQHILENWLDAGVLEPRYIKVTGHGRNGSYSASVLDPISNPKLQALSSKKIEVVPVGTTSIGIIANDKKIMKMRFKYESEKLASSIKLSGDPW